MSTTTFHSFRELLVWQRAMQMAEVIFKLTSSFPEKENYGLASLMRRSAVYIPCTIAEGKKRGTRKEFLYALSLAQNTAVELDTQMELAKNIHGEKFADFKKAEGLLLEVMKMLSVLRKKVTPAQKK